MINNELIELMTKSYCKMYIIYYLYGETIYMDKKNALIIHTKKRNYKSIQICFLKIKQYY